MVIEKDHYEIRKRNSYYIIKRKVFPKIRLHINFDYPYPKIIKASLNDKCSVRVMENTLKEIDELISFISSSQHVNILQEAGYHIKEETYDDQTIPSRLA